MVIAKLLMLIGAICAAMLLGMYLNAAGIVDSSVEKMAYAVVMLVVNAGGLLFITSKG